LNRNLRNALSRGYSRIIAQKNRNKTKKRRMEKSQIKSVTHGGTVNSNSRSLDHEDRAKRKRRSVRDEDKCPIQRLLNYLKGGAHREKQFTRRGCEVNEEGGVGGSEGKKGN